MSKGAETRRAILDHALEVATKEGLEGLTIGRLAQDLRLSKSGLFAHFRGKDELLLQVLETARTRFIEQVVRPGLAAPRGEPRAARPLRELALLGAVLGASRWLPVRRSGRGAGRSARPRP